MSADIPVGARIRFWRMGRGLTQLQLATRAGISLDYLGMIERGQRPTPSLYVLRLLAQVLHISLDVLRGQGQVEPGGMGHPAVPSIRDALLGLGQWSPSPGLDLEVFQEQVTFLGSTWFGNGSYDLTGQLLPELIREADHLHDAFTTHQEEKERRRAAQLAFQVYYVGNHFTNDVGALDVAIVTRERMVRAADASDDPVVIAASRWLLSLKLLKEGHLDASEEVIRQQIEGLEGRREPDLTTQSLLGMMNAAGSIAAVRQRDVDSARSYADKAARIAAATGENSIYWSAWGPTNVGIYMAEIEAEYGDPQDGLRAAQQLSEESLAGLPVAERRAHHFTHVAWLYDQLDQDPGTILHLQRAQREAPEEFRYNRLAQQLIGPLLRRSRSTYHREVGELAQHAGMLP